MTVKKNDPFDISDTIGGTKPAPTPPPKTFTTNPTIQSKPTGVMIAIPVGRKFKSVDVGLCSSIEFIEWLSFVYPVEKDFSENEVKNVSQKLELVKRMEGFHSKLILAGKNKDLSNN